jgi:thiol-disulfide isomerase/thioredoxin
LVGVVEACVQPMETFANGPSTASPVSRLLQKQNARVGNPGRTFAMRVSAFMFDFPFMNRSLPLLAAALLLAALIQTACSPSKEDQPPKPKVTASTTETSDAKSMKASSVPASPAMALPTLGAAPAWKLKDLNGAIVSSDQFKGKIVVVDFWATWCPPCRAEIPGYTELTKKYGKDVAIIGVSLDEGGPGVVKSFAEKQGINYQLVMGDEAVVAAFGGFQGIPTTFLIDRTGQIRDRKEGAEPTAVYEKKIQALLN